MDKISSIIPATKRVTSVDLQNAFPVRSGMPSFGRPQAPIGPDRFTRSQAAMALQLQQAQPTPMQEPPVTIVDKIIDDFFMRNNRPAAAAAEPEEIFVVVPPKVDGRNAELVEVAQKDGMARAQALEPQSIDIMA